MKFRDAFDEEMTDVVIPMATDLSIIKRHLEDNKGELIYKRDLEDVKEELINIGDSVGEMKETLARVERKPDVDDGSDIREKRTRIHKEDCSTLSVSPLFEEETTELLKIYQNPTMFCIDHNKEQGKENSKHELHEEQTKEDKKVITSYQGIFCKEGIGKTGVGYQINITQSLIKFIVHNI